MSPICGAGGGKGELQETAQKLTRTLACRFITILEEQKIPRGIIIFKTNMTPSANKVRRALSDHPPRIDRKSVV